MAKRKFTPPTSFPAEYVDGDGTKVVIYGRGKGDKPLIGQMEDQHGFFYGVTYSEDGVDSRGDSWRDLHDIPKRITTWHNVYDKWISPQRIARNDADAGKDTNRLCVYRIERDEDGGNPEIFVEKVEDFKEEV